MKKILSSINSPYDYSRWHPENILKVFAGKNAIMAITHYGGVESCATGSCCGIYFDCCESIVDISISKWMPGLAIGLTTTGSAILHRVDTLRTGKWHRTGFNSFRFFNDREKLVQVAASDAFFSLSRVGTVDYIAFDSYTEEDYRGVLDWHNIARIVTGNQNSVFGITHDGRVFAEGANCRRGPHGDINEYLKDFTDVVDLAPTGSECEMVFLLHRDGSVSDYNGRKIPIDAKIKKLDSYFWNSVVGLSTDNQLIHIVSERNQPGTLIFSERVSSFAMDGDGHIIAISCDE